MFGNAVAIEVSVEGVWSGLDAVQIHMLLWWGGTVLGLSLSLAALIHHGTLPLGQGATWQRWRDLVFGADALQRAFLLRYCVGLINAFAGLMALNFGVERGAIDPDDAHQLTVAALVVGLGWLVFMRAGWNRMWSDQGMSEPQVMVATGFLAWGYVIGGPGRPVALMILFIILMFCMFRVSSAQLVRCCLWAMLVFGAAFGKVAILEQRTPYQSEMQAIYFGLLVIILISMCLMISYLQALRARSSARKRELCEALARLNDLATHDELTGLYNRRHMLEMLQSERSRAARSGQPWCLCMIDIDHFKSVNDRHGHGAGDEVLQAIARLVSSGLRDSDQVARWGGEEFLVMLPNTRPDEAVVVIERIRQALLRTGVSRTVPDLRVTFSAGVAAVQPHHSLPAAVALADQALYQAKATGRDATVVASAQAPSEHTSLVGVR